MNDRQCGRGDAQRRRDAAKESGTGDPKSGLNQ